MLNIALTVLREIKVRCISSIFIILNDIFVFLELQWKYHFSNFRLISSYALQLAFLYIRVFYYNIYKKQLTYIISKYRQSSQPVSAVNFRRKERL